MKTVVMLYEDGSRSHTIQEEEIFKGSNIKSFIADRAPLYETIVKDLEEYHIVRAALTRRLVVAMGQGRAPHTPKCPSIRDGKPAGLS